MEKNKDPLNDTAVSTLKAAKDNQLMQDIWADYQTQEELAVAEKTKGMLFSLYDDTFFILGIFILLNIFLIIQFPCNIIHHFLICRQSNRS